MGEFSAGHQYGFITAILMMKKKMDYYLDNLENSGMSEESKKEIKKMIKDIFEKDYYFDEEDSE